VADLRVFFHRPEVKQFAACVERRGTGRGAGELEGAGFWVVGNDGKETGVFPTVTDFGRTREGRTFAELALPAGSVANFHSHSPSGGSGPSPLDMQVGTQMPVFTLHKPSGVRVYEQGLADEGVPVARSGWYRGLANRSTCRQYN